MNYFRHVAIATFNNNTQWFVCLIIKFTVNKTQKFRIIKYSWTEFTSAFHEDRGFMNNLIDFSCFVFFFFCLLCFERKWNIHKQTNLKCISICLFVMNKAILSMGDFKWMIKHSTFPLFMTTELFEIFGASILYLPPNKIIKP